MKQEDGQKQQKSGKLRQKENDDAMKRKSLRQGNQLDRPGLPGQRIETVKVSWDSPSQVQMHKTFIIITIFHSCSSID